MQSLSIKHLFVMTRREEKFIATWTTKMDKGQVPYFIRNTLLTCLASAVVILFYTWNNIPENKFFESLIPLSILIFGFGIPLGILLSWRSWVQQNNRYKSLTTGLEFPSSSKRKWEKHDKVWDVVISAIGAFYFLLLFTSIFLFDSGKPTILKFSIVGIILSYFVAQFCYTVYRYKADRSGKTKKFLG